MFDDVKKLLKHSSIYSLGTLLSKIVSFIMLPVYTRCLTPSDYGTLELLTLTTSVISILVSLRLTSALPRFYYGAKTQKEKNSLVSTMLLFSLGLSALIVVLLYENRMLFSRLVFKDESHGIFFSYVFLSIVFEISTQINFTYLRVKEKPYLFAGASLLQLILGLSFNILFLVYFKMGVMGVLYSMVLSNGIICVLSQIYSFMDVGFHLNLGQLKTLLIFSLPLVPAAFAGFVLNMGDRFILSQYVSTAEIGYYSLGYKFGMLVGVFIGGPFLLAWEPKRFQIFEKDPNEKSLFSKVFLYFFFSLVFSALILCFYIQEIITLFATPEYSKACTVTPFVALGYIFFNLYYILDIGFLFEKKTYWYFIISSTAAGVNVGLNFILIPQLGILGAAIATTGAFLVLPVMAFTVSQKYYPIQYDLLKAGKILIVGLVWFFVAQKIQTPSLILNISLKAILLLMYPVFLTLIKVFGKGEIKAFKDAIRVGLMRFRLVS